MLTIHAAEAVHRDRTAPFLQPHRTPRTRPERHRWSLVATLRRALSRRDAPRRPAPEVRGVPAPQCC